MVSNYILEFSLVISVSGMLPVAFLYGMLYSQPAVSYGIGSEISDCATELFRVQSDNVDD